MNADQSWQTDQRDPMQHSPAPLEALVHAQ